MKILTLRLNNLASLAGEHAIHFDQAPLAHAGLIAITGKTGAGKSTLLDAMCLALYDEIPRLRGAAGSMKDVGGKDISIKDSKNILRRGTTSGYAELEFIALDGKRYQARWDISRARKKVDGNLKVERAITCLDDQRVLTQKISEVTPLVEKLIGLSFEQFTRAVLLAQSEVGAFLKAKDHERADLLEYLTNSHIFSWVSIKAAEKYGAIKQQRTELEKLLGHIEMLSEEEIAEIQAQQQQHHNALQTLTQNEKILEHEKQWHVERHQLYADVQAKKEVYDVQLDAMHKSASQQQLLAQLDAFQEIRAQYELQQQLKPQQQQVQQQQHAFVHEFDALKQRVAEAKSQFDACNQKQQQFEQHLQTLKPHLEQALQLDHEIQTISEQYKQRQAQLEQFNQSRLTPLSQQLHQLQFTLSQSQAERQQQQQQLAKTEQLAILDQQLPNLLQRLQDAQRLQQQARAADADFDQPLAQLEQQYQQQQQIVQALTERYQHIDELEKTLSQRLEQQHSLERQQLQAQHLQQDVGKLEQQFNELQQLQDSCIHLQTQLTEHNQTAQQLQQQLAQEQDKYAQLEQMLAQQRLLHSHSVQELRAQLQPNAACMVCGSHEHPFVQHQDLLQQSLLNLQEQQLQQAKTALEDVRQAQQQHAVAISKLHTQLEQQQQRIAQLQPHTAQAQQHLSAQLAALGISINVDDAFNKVVTQLQQQQQQWSEQLTAQQTQIAQLQTDLAAWRQATQQLQRLDNLLKQHAQLNQWLSPIATQLPQLNCHSQSTDLAEIEHQLHTRLHGLQRLQQLDSQLSTQQQAVEKAQAEYTLQQQHYAELQQQVEDLIQLGKKRRQQLAELTQQYAQRSYRLGAEWRADLDQQATQLQQQVHQQRELNTNLERQLHQANLKQQEFITHLQQLEQQLLQIEQQIQTWQLAHPQLTASMIAQYLQIDLAAHQRLRQDLQKQQQALDNAKTAWQLLEEQYQAHLKQQPEHDFEQVEAQLLALQTQKQQQQDAFNELEAKLRLNANHQSTYAKYKQQIEQIKAEEYRWGRIYDLIGHKEGTKFKKIAQEHHLDILVEYANQQLQPLAPRYQLHRIPDSLSLAIMDLDMNSEIRPVLSLSGGETFLVSLALALAIANMASGSMKLESLFIDEGFGTLDPASLHMVMNALDHLQSQGRKVVLISHVQEMHERIPVKIQVKPVGSGASTLEITG